MEQNKYFTAEELKVLCEFSYIHLKTIIGKLDDEDVLTKWKNHTLGEIIQEIMDNQEYKSRIVPNGCYAPKELLAVMSEEIMSNEKLKSLKLKGLRDETTIKNGKCGSGLLGYAFDVPVTSGPKQTLLLYTGSEGRAVEGTSGNDMTSTDWVNNFRMGLSDYSNQYNPAVEFAKDMTKDGSVGFVTGHSQGGNDYIYSYGGTTLYQTAPHCSPTTTKPSSVTIAAS